MTVATGVNEQIGYIAEVTIGTTPATPAFQLIEVTSFGLNESREIIQDNRLGSRDRKCNKQGNRSVSGDIGLLLEYGAYDDFLSAALCADWEADTPSVGSDRLVNSNLRKGFTFERYNPELESPNQYRYYKGCEINSFNLALAQNDNINLTLSVIGVESTALGAAIAGRQTPVAAPGECSFDYKYGSFEVDATEVANITAFDLTVTNNIEASNVLFSDKTGDKPIGKCDVQGSVTAQFEDAVLYNKFMNDESAALIITMEDAAASPNTYVVSIPKTMINNPVTDTSGDGEITLSADIVGEYDATLDGTISIVRTAAA